MKVMDRKKLKSVTNQESDLGNQRTEGQKLGVPTPQIVGGGAQRRTDRPCAMLVSRTWKEIFVF